MQERNLKMMKVRSWFVPIVQLQQHLYGEGMMKVHHCVMHVVYSKVSHWLDNKNANNF
jgi:hypothetical protein